MKQLRKGDPCPCCGQPIKTDDPDILRLLSLIATQRRFPTIAEIADLKQKEGD